MANPYILGTTGPSIFNPEVKSLVEDYFESIPLYINQDTEEGLEWVLKNINGLILAGGRDVCPISYNEEITNGDSLSSFDMERFPLYGEWYTQKCTSPSFYGTRLWYW